MTSESTKPELRVDVYGTNSPNAAKFGVGARTLDEIEKATKARVDSRPGDYYGK